MAVSPHMFAEGNREDYDDILAPLDIALEQKSVYEQYLLDRVMTLKSILQEQTEPAHIYSLNKRIAQEFMSYNLDSTILYLTRCRNVALSSDSWDKVVESDIMLAEEYTRAGYHLESIEILNAIDPEGLTKGLVLPYLTAQHNLAGERLAYATDSRMFRIQDSLRTYYRNLMLKRLEPESLEWFKLKREESMQFGRRKEALKYTDKLLSLSEEGSREYAICCYLYQELLDKDNQREEKLKWLVKSACTDVKCATRDYASLNDLAVILFESGDIDRAFEYSADHCMPDAISFGGKLRPWQISQFFPGIGLAYQDKNNKWQESMNYMLIALLVLILVLLFLMTFIFLRQQVLVKTRKALSASYLEIEHRNADLLEANRKLSELNLKITESDKVKQEYIALFLGMFSENINKTRQYKNHVLKYIRHGNVKEIESEIEALPPIDEDIMEFYKMFDETFLNLYPGFVEKFNALLVDEEAVIPKGEDSLTPELRVFALIKLGITDSSKIATLLHYSANTIYNYRAKIKNRAKGDRSAFEDAVRLI